MFACEPTNMHFDRGSKKEKINCLFKLTENLNKNHGCRLLRVTTLFRIILCNLEQSSDHIKVVVVKIIFRFPLYVHTRRMGKFYVFYNFVEINYSSLMTHQKITFVETVVSIAFICQIKLSRG